MCSPFNFPKAFVISQVDCFDPPPPEHVLQVFGHPLIMSLFLPQRLLQSAQLLYLSLHALGTFGAGSALPLYAVSKKTQSAPISQVPMEYNRQKKQLENSCQCHCSKILQQYNYIPLLTLMNPLSPQPGPQEFLISQYGIPCSVPHPTIATA